jgi:hypothetical protein
MQLPEVTRINNPSEEAEAHYIVRAGGGDAFSLSFKADLLGAWREQLARSSTPLDLDTVAERLAEEIVELGPSNETLHDGVVVTMDNGAFTPMAAEDNLASGGIGPFLKHDATAAHDGSRDFESS